MEDKEYHLQILDTSGSESYWDVLAEKWLSSSDGFLLVYAADSKSSFKILESFRVRLMTLLKDDRIPIVVVGCKSNRGLHHPLNVP